MQLETFLIALTTIIATITASVAIVKKSREYNMCVFLCKEFFVLALGIFFAFVALYIVEPEDAKTPAFIITFAISVLFSAYNNIKKSNLIFGIIFTLFQFFSIAFSVLIIAALFQRRRV